MVDGSGSPGRGPVVGIRSQNSPEPWPPRNVLGDRSQPPPIFVYAFAVNPTVGLGVEAMEATGIYSPI